MIDSTGEREVDATDKVRVKETRQNEICFFIVVVIVECMGRENGYVKVLFVDRVDRNFAVHDEGGRAYLISCVWRLIGLRSAQRLNDQLRRGPSDCPPLTILPSSQARLVAAHIFLIWLYAPT
jgi:hypothetical protein